MFKIENDNKQKKIISIILSKVERLLKEMQNDGKDLSYIKLKKFQKTHHINCECQLCAYAKSKNDHSLRGLTEDGFKVYIDDYKKGCI